jgi:Ca2+:H+ antiporter
MLGSPPSLLETIRRIIFYSWTNLLLAFVPVGMATYLTDATPSLVFTSNALAVIPLSGLLTMATECIAQEMGDNIGALLNISLEFS